MVEMTRYCADCGWDRLFEQHHATDGSCPDSPDGWCCEWFCTDCGAAVLIGVDSALADAAQALELQPGRRVA